DMQLVSSVSQNRTPCGTAAGISHFRETLGHRMGQSDYETGTPRRVAVAWRASGVVTTVEQCLSKRLTHVDISAGNEVLICANLHSLPSLSSPVLFRGSVSGDNHTMIAGALENAPSTRRWVPV